MSGASGLGSLVTFFSYILEMGLSVLLIVSTWRIFEKAGEPGWKCLIPFYGQYIGFKIAGKKKLFWVELVLMIIMYIAMFALLFSMVFNLIASGYTNSDQISESMAMSLVAQYIGFILIEGGLAIALWIIQLVKNIALGKAFGHGAAFGVGLSFLPFVFNPILAFENNSYYGTY